MTNKIKKRKNMLEFIKKYIFMTMGSAIFAIGVACFYEPCSLAPGGVSGIAVIIHSLFNFLPTGMLIVVINIPIMIVGAWRLGARFLIGTLYTILATSIMIDLFSAHNGALTVNPLLAAFAGSLLVALGLGIVFRTGATTGGTDVIVKLLRNKFRYLDTGTIFLAVDGAIVIASWPVLGDIDIALHSAIALMMQMIVMNKVLYGDDEARLVYIISDKKEAISKRVLGELDAGATVLLGQGAYTKKQKDILLVTMRMRQLPMARDIVKDEDPDAFVIVTSASSVFGKGFKSHDSEEL